MQISRKIFPDPEQLTLAAAHLLQEHAANCITSRDCFSLVLAGGSTPANLYHILSQPPFLDSIDWSRVYIFFGDERYVPHDHADSNFAMAKNKLLDHVPIPESQIYPIPTDCEVAGECSSRYARDILTFFAEHPKLDTTFDMVLLGMGDDGHTASLFPHTPILHEREVPADAVYVDKLQTWRISMTYDTLNRSRKVLFLVTGENKAATVAKVFRGDSTIEDYPSKGIHPVGECCWYLDEQAASQILKG